MLKKSLLIILLILFLVPVSSFADRYNTWTYGQVRERNNSIVWKWVPCWYPSPGAYYTYNYRYSTSASWMNHFRTGQYLATYRTNISRFGNVWGRDYNNNRRLEMYDRDRYGRYNYTTVVTAHYNMYRALRYYWLRCWSRRSWDNKGSTIIVHTRPGLRNAYAYLGRGFFVFGEGSYGRSYSGTFANLGIAARMLTHAVLSVYPTRLPYRGYQAAVHHGFAEVMGVGAMYTWGERDCWNMIPVRDLKSPRYWSQYAKASYQPHLGGHVLAHACYQMARYIGTYRVTKAAYYAMIVYVRSNDNIRTAWYKIVYSIYRLYGYNYYRAAHYASWKYLYR
jgi:Zn-dependent metalloprotease